MIVRLAVTYLCLFLLSSWIPLAILQCQTTIQVETGVILEDLNSVRGQTLLSCIKMAISDFYFGHPCYKTRLVLKARDSKKNVVGAAASAFDLIKNEEVRTILGPVTSMETSFVINLGDQAHVPIISFSATSPALTSLRSSYFFQFAQNDTSQVKAISAVIKSFGWRLVVLMYIDTTYGEAVIPFLTDAVQEAGAAVAYRSVISPIATDDQIAEELYKLMSMQTRVFIVHMTTNMSSKVFSKAEEIGMMVEGYAWLTTSGITNRLASMNNSVIDTMKGVIGVQTYVHQTRKLEEFEQRWRRQFQNDHPEIIGAELDVYGLWAYDATFAIAMAVEQVMLTTRNLGFHKPNALNESISILQEFPISPYGRQLSKALSATRFLGLAGEVSLIEGQLQSSNFRIINVDDHGARTLGFYTPRHGLVSKMSSSDTLRRLGPVIWPGETSSFPKGWEIPTKGKLLKIGVPVRDGFTELVKVTFDPVTNTTEVTGFSIDVFKAVLEMLHYALPYEFIPYAKPDGTAAGTYNDLCYEVYLGHFDAVVGDTTIRANRSLYVDFTMPYAEAGVVMVVPVVNSNKRSAWAFFQPWSWSLWLATLVSLLLIGFVVWVVQHRTNEDFQDINTRQEVGNVVWFAFATMVFSQTHRMDTNLARFVMIIWLFVVLVLIQNYQASLTSIYTVQMLEPTVTDIKDLLRKGETIGYISTAYTYEMLKQIGFKDPQLMALGTVEAIDEALSKGSSNNGIAAFVDETPYMKIFLAKYCTKYTMVGPIFKTDGHGFVFPKRSPLTPDVSQAVLNVTGGEKILNLENKWFKKDSKCLDLNNPTVSSSKLDFESFHVLFYTTLIAAGLALIHYIFCFCFKYSDIWEGETTTRRKIKAMFIKFLEIDTAPRSNRAPDVGTASTTPNGTVGQHTNSDSEVETTPLITDQPSSAIPVAYTDPGSSSNQVLDEGTDSTNLNGADSPRLLGQHSNHTNSYSEVELAATSSTDQPSSEITIAYTESSSAGQERHTNHSS